MSEKDNKVILKTEDVKEHIKNGLKPFLIDTLQDIVIQYYLGDIKVEIYERLYETPDNYSKGIERKRLCDWIGNFSYGSTFYRDVIVNLYDNIARVSSMNQEIQLIEKGKVSFGSSKPSFLKNRIGLRDNSIKEIIETLSKNSKGIFFKKSDIKENDTYMTYMVYETARNRYYFDYHYEKFIIELQVLNDICIAGGVTFKWT